MENKFKRVQEEIEELKWHLFDDSLTEKGKEKLKELETLMDYAHSSLQLKDKNRITFDEYLKKHYKWYNGFYYESKEGGYFTNGQIADKYKKEVYDKPLIV